MKERPILFSAPMVRAILEGRKTQTRIVITPQPTHALIEGLAHVTVGMDPALDGRVWYDGDCIGPGREVRSKWRIGDHLLVRSNITLEVEAVRVERVHDISEADAMAEGCERVQQLGILRSCGWKDYSGKTPGFMRAGNSFRTLWDSINGKTHPWDANPWVWAITFRRIEA
jgi:hypothetical protein